MLTLTKSLFALMLGFIGATIFGLIIIPFLSGDVNMEPG